MKCNRWPDQVNNSSYLFPQVQVKKSLLSWACCDAYLAQRRAEGAGQETDEGPLKATAHKVQHKPQCSSAKARHSQGKHTDSAIISTNASH